MGNRTFFKNSKENKMTLGDIFADVLKHHSEEEANNVFIAGTEKTTPKEEDMLAVWTKPFLFAKFFGIFLLGLGVLYAAYKGLDYNTMGLLLMLGIAVIVPITLLLLVWEMNIPRNIPINEIMRSVFLGGVLSVCFTAFAQQIIDIVDPKWAGLIEEPAKLLVIYFLMRKKNRPYILNGVLTGVAVGTGFAALESITYALGMGLMNGGIEGGIHIALVRALTAIAGHGFYAGLYGGGLAMAKGREELEVRHLFSVDFLKYFILSIAMHAYHNSGVSFGLPVFFDGLLPTEWIIEALIAIYILLELLKKGVNEVVTICAQKNGGRVTMAVNRGAYAPQPAAAGKVTLEAISGPYMGKIYAIGIGQEMTIGRSEGKNGIALPACKNASSTHCQIKASESQIMVKDLNSTNGTYINEQKLAPYQERYVGNGSIIYLGDKNCGFLVRIQ